MVLFNDTLACLCLCFCPGKRARVYVACLCACIRVRVHTRTCAHARGRGGSCARSNKSQPINADALTRGALPCHGSSCWPGPVAPEPGIGALRGSLEMAPKAKPKAKVVPAPPPAAGMVNLNLQVEVQAALAKIRAHPTFKDVAAKAPAAIDAKLGALSGFEDQQLPNVFSGITTTCQPSPAVHRQPHNASQPPTNNLPTHPGSLPTPLSSTLAKGFLRLPAASPSQRSGAAYQQSANS